MTWDDPATTANDIFGGAVATSGVGVGATAVVGAPGTNSNDGATDVYVRGRTGWPSTPTATLADPAATSNDLFGDSVAVSGNTAVVGAYGSNSFSGAAYIFVKGHAGWPRTPTATLSDPAATSQDDFGLSVAVSGHTVVVGAYGTSSDAGAAYVYVKGRSGWPRTPTATLADPAATSNDLYGASVAVSGDRFVVGAYGTNSDAGAAYVYVEGHPGWPSTPTATLADPAATSNDLFGAPVAVAGNTVVVGASGTNSNTGVAYTYAKRHSGWPSAPIATLVDPAATPGDAFGSSVAVVCGGAVVVGAFLTDNAAGAAYLYDS